MNNMNLHSAALLVEFNASVWTARKLDRAVTDEVVADKQAGAKSAGRFNKNLFAGRTELEDIAKHVTKVRGFVMNGTLPWSDGGQRLLPTGAFMKFDKRMDAYKEEFDELAETFITAYPTLITAQAMALGQMFNRNDFPSAHEIAHKFAFSYTYLPVPKAGDFRVDIGNEAQEELRARLETASQARLDAATKDLTDRLVTHLKRMSDRLTSDKDVATGDVKSRRFHDTIVSSAYDLCDLIHGLNVTNDPELERSRRVLENCLSGVTAETLRNDPGKRDDVKAQVDNLLSKFSF